MKKSSHRNQFRLKFQIVCTVSPKVAEISPEEAEEIRDAARGALRNHRCEVVETGVAERWISVLIDADPAVSLPKAASSLKAVLARRVNRMRGGQEAFWTPGYAVFSLGEQVIAPEIATQLEERSRHE